jgi:hypothetical protein
VVVSYGRFTAIESFYIISDKQNIMEKRKYPRRTSLFYWAWGGDLFWVHFNISFLKIALFVEVTFGILTNLIAGATDEVVFIILAGVHALLILTVTWLIFKNEKVARFALRENSTTREARWVLAAICLLSIVMPSVLAFA